MAASRRILVVDDDRTLRETLREVLVDDGYEVRAASNGRQALASLDDWEADLVILDIMMPVMDAFEFREAQHTAGAPLAPLIILSAAPGLSDAAERLQAAGVVTKPFHLADLLSEVERVLEPHSGMEREATPAEGSRQ
jgi:CheY-like chemotaxis protein